MSSVFSRSLLLLLALFIRDEQKYDLFLGEKRNMSKRSTSKASQTDWARLNTMRDEDIDLSDIPEVTEEQMARAVLRVGGKPVPKGKV